MRRSSKNYSNEGSSVENLNEDNKYSITGESSYSRDMTFPPDQNGDLIERHYTVGEAELDFRGLGPKGYKRSDDSIYEDVCETLYRSVDIDASDIDVMVNEGIVSLKGTVGSRKEKRLAEGLLDEISGVQDIINELQIRRNEDGLIQNWTGLN